MNPMNRAALVAALISVTALAVSTNAAAGLNDDLVDETVNAEVAAAAIAPHRCTWTGAHYECVGYYHFCVVSWTDDDANGDPTDPKAHITDNICPVFEIQYVLPGASV